MKILSLQISNIWSFKHHDSIEDAPKIAFDENFNILIGQNGAGKSTALEVINFIFRRVLFIPYNRNSDLYRSRNTILVGQKKSILTKIDNALNYNGFRLERNYDFEGKVSRIRIRVKLDEVDKENISLLQTQKPELSQILETYAIEQLPLDITFQNEYKIDIEMSGTNRLFSVNTTEDAGFIYLRDYNLYREAIRIYNEENESNQILNLAETFAFLGSYRNYSNYTSTASLSGDASGRNQIQNFRTQEYSRSMNSAETTEPTVFSLVRLQMASACYDLVPTGITLEESERAANNLDFIRAINEKIAIVNLKVEITLTNLSTWEFAFSFRDTKRHRLVSDISALSAGQKAIIHLVFEAYGRGNLNGGLVIIDEPEIHLHYQFQNEYLRIIEKLNIEQGSQYVLVTHSESLITSSTISSVIRFSLDSDGYTSVQRPEIATDQKWLVKILDNRRSTHAFFGSKVLIVEGESDRYFYRAIINEIETRLKRGLPQEITVLDSEGKKFNEWRRMFESFGLKTFIAGDLDCAWKYYTNQSTPKLSDSTKVAEFLASHPDVIERIEADYELGIFILKEGDLEDYLGLHQKDLRYVITFCENNLVNFLEDTANRNVSEIWEILTRITGVSKNQYSNSI